MVSSGAIDKASPTSGEALVDGGYPESAPARDAREEKSDGEGEPTPKAVSETSTLEDVIRSGRHEEVGVVLGRMPKEEAAQKLTAVGGKKHREATPILHSARSGNVALFEAVHKYMEIILDDAQMVEALAARHDDETNIYTEEQGEQHLTPPLGDGEKLSETHRYKVLLAMVAAEGGSKDVFDAVVNEEAITGLLESEKEAVQLLTRAARGGNNSIFCKVKEAANGKINAVASSPVVQDLLFGAARGGSSDVFHTVLNVLGDRACDVVEARSFSGYTILMAAARGGSVDIVSLVQKQLAGYQDKSKVKEMIRANNREGYSCLLTAIQSGRPDVVEKVADIMKEHLGEDMGEVQRMIATPCLLGDTSFMVAASVPHGDYFVKVVKILEPSLPSPQMRRMLTATGRREWNVLMEAVQFGHRDVIGAVMRVLRDKLEPHEVSRILFSRDGDGETLLMLSTRSGRVEAVEGVVEAMEKQVEADKSCARVKRALTARGNNGSNILILAVLYGKLEVLSSVEKIVNKRLTKDQVVKMIQASWNDRTMLTGAAEQGKISTVKAAKQLMSFKYLTKAQAVSMVQSGLDPTDERPTIFMGAALAKGSMEAVEAVVNLARKYLKDGQVVELMKAEVTKYNVFRLVTEYDRDPACMKALLKMLDMLTSDQVMKLMDFGDGRGRTLLVLAVESGVSEIVKLVDQFVRGGKLSRNQVQGLLWKNNRERCKALKLAAQGHDKTPEIYRIMVDLTEEYKVSVMQDNKPDIGVSFARSRSASLGSGGGARPRQDEIIASQLSTEGDADIKRAEGDIGQPLATPKGGVNYPTSGRNGAGPDSIGGRTPSGGISETQTPQKVSDISSVSEAISSGNPPAVEQVLEKMTDGEAVKELCGPQNARITPILRAARQSDQMFSAVLEQMKARLNKSQMAAALAGGTDAIGYLRVEKKRFSDTVASSKEPPDAFSRALVLVAAQGGSKEVLDVALEKGLRGERLLLSKLFEDSRDVELLFLAAARGGSIDVLNYILSDLQAKAMALGRNLGGTVGKNLLYEAVKGGSVKMLRRVLGMLGDKEVGAIIADRFSASTILIKAAESGRLDVLKKAMVLLKTKPLKELLLHAVDVTVEDRHATILAAAARSGQAEAIQASMKTVQGALAHGQVVSMIQAKTSTGGTILTEAVGSGSSGAIEAVMDAMSDVLKRDQVSAMIRDVDADGYNLFVQAILGGSPEGVQAIAMVMDKTLQKEQVLAALQFRGKWPAARAPKGRKFSTLELAAGTGSRKMFEAVLGILYENLRADQILQMVEAANDLGFSLLQLCAKTGIQGVFDAAVEEIDCYPGEQVRKMIMPQGQSGDSVLADAILSGSREVVDATMKVMERRLQLNGNEMLGIIQRSDAEERNILMMAISRNEKVFEAVTGILDKHLAGKRREFLGMLLASDGEGQNLLAWASKQTTDGFTRTADYVQKIAPEKVLDMIRRKDEQGRTIVMAAASSGDQNTIKEVTSFVEDKLDDEEVSENIAPKTEERKCSIICEAAKSGKRAAVETARNILLKKLDGDQVSKELATAFELCADEASKERLTRSDNIRGPSEVADRLDDAAIILGYGAMPKKKIFASFLNSFENETDRLKDCFQYAVSSASNPFVPGMTLSVLLADAAAHTVVEGKRRALLSLQREVDDLLLEIFERLPQTVAGFLGKDDDCTAMLEPGTTEKFPNGFVGPLGLALTERRHMEKFCVTPLVLDFMARKFTLGLPKLRNKDNGPTDQESLGPEEDGKRLLETNGLLHDPPLDMVGRMLHGACNGDLPSLLPGAQFIIVGIVSKPSSYYEVPVLRMVLNFVVYLLMLVLFSTRVLIQDYSDWNRGEFALALYIVASVITEISEVREDYKKYLRDPWNVLDVLALLLLGGGSVTRVVDNGQVWGQYLYALSAPALFSRILFFGQILPAQGPMIQVILSMTRELVTFGVIMVVVMFGFAMCFFTLFQDLQSETYGKAWLGIFKAIFGDVELFDEVSGHQVDGIATVVLVLYMTVMTIMLLNLLIAVLSTAHANVQQSVHKEFEISKVRMIDLYRRVVKEDLLPAPFNLVQHAVSLPFKRLRQDSPETYRAVKKSVGIAVFSLVLGPVAVGVAFLLGNLSVLKVIYKIWKNSKKRRLSRVGVVSWCALCSCLVLPACLTILWLKKAAHAIALMLYSPRTRPTNSASTPPKSYSTVDENLKRPQGGSSVSELRVYLDNPMNEQEVRRDEETRRATVEHIKLLRNRLEDKGDQRIKPLWGELNRLGAGVSDLDGKVEEVHRKLSEKFDEMHRMFAIFSEKLDLMKEKEESKQA